LQTLAESQSAQSLDKLYLAALDGLRFVAFLLVFFHHLRVSEYTSELHRFGWAGVELFFVISAFLFFHLLGAEHAKAGRISVLAFYARRVLRIYPLLRVFPLVMYPLSASSTGDFFWKYLLLISGTDNIVTAVHSWDLPIRHTAHLRTIPFELQIYLVIPLAFYVYLRLGSRVFISCLVALSGRGCPIFRRRHAAPFHLDDSGS
jgi:peptidoglycan/LPS O-acetylase OafA/YrhL